MAGRRLGQHFLRAGWPEQIAKAIGLSRQAAGHKDERPYCWIEIGAGHGEMTAHLAATGVPVHAVELDPPLVSRLRELRSRFPNLTVLPGDVLQTDLAAIASGRRIKLYGNLPYYITSPILHHFFSSAALIEEIHVVIQAEVARRLVAQPGNRDYGYLSVLTQYYSRPAMGLELPPGAFEPPPEVASALVSLHLPGEGKRLQMEDSRQFLAFVKACFAHKRKTVVNNLRGTSPPDRTKQALAGLQRESSARAEELSVAELAALFRTLAG